MRQVFRTAAFKRDYRRVLRSTHGIHIRETLTRAVELLAADRPLPANYADHPLKGPWHGHRECHLRPDLLLIYRKLPRPGSVREVSPPMQEGSGAAMLQLIRLGSHPQLFGS